MLRCCRRRRHQSRRLLSITNQTSTTTGTDPYVYSLTKEKNENLNSVLFFYIYLYICSYSDLFSKCENETGVVMILITNYSILSKAVHVIDYKYVKKEKNLRLSGSVLITAFDFGMALA